MADERVVFACPVCGQALTRPLAPLPPDQSICYEDGQPAVPPGYFAVSSDEYWTGSEGCPVVNLADLAGTAYHPDTRRRSGCCGPSGTEGPNLVCGRGHEVGAERSDCWMSHAAVLLREVVWRRQSEVEA